MICELCKGKGWVQGQAPDIPTACPACDGKGFIEQTNEEWIKSMTTEELAEWIYCTMFYKSCQKDVEDGAYMQMMTKKDYIENWLKEKHEE